MDEIIEYIHSRGYELDGVVDANGGSAKRFYVRKLLTRIGRFLDIDMAYWTAHEPGYFVPLFTRCIDAIEQLEQEVKSL